MIITVVLVIFTRPFAIKKLKIGNNKTNVNSLIGSEVIVTKKITEFDKGEAKAKNGVIWTATSDNNKTIEKGTVCSIISVEGNTIIIKEKE